ncbi:glycoside hydrolase family 3 N-terminal domain-containing protein [Streptomyces sp. NPDC005426]|uniref:glycoside hydrolase family 3 protein n=1 Tax=Streptomyces sp. NPDC005426 TaxID=3155344 RepID=UPI0033ACED23
MTTTAAPVYRDATTPLADRVEDLLARMTLRDKAGLFFHDMVVPGPDGHLAGSENFLGRPATVDAVQNLRMTHFNLVGPINDVRAHVRWYNRLQETALDTPLGIPVTLSTDPRHSFSSNAGTAALAGAFSQWPETLGLAALRDDDLVEQYADVVRREYLATGLRVALHPQIDLATEPRWSRSGMTFGEDSDLTGRLVGAYLRGLQGEEFGPTSVSAVVKHFPGGGPQKDGEDPHFPYGKEQIYPAGKFDHHLQPFIAALQAGARQMMPYYGMPVGTPFEEVAFGFNRDIITGLLREQLGFDGIVCTDWGLLTDAVIFGQPVPARAWGLEHLDPHARALRALHAGADQFGGESVPHLLEDLVERGDLEESRLDTSVRRLLAEKFALGLFDQPFLDEDEALEVVGHPDHIRLGQATQRAAVTRLTAAPATSAAALHHAPGDRRIYTEGLSAQAAARLGRPVDSPEHADAAVLRLQAPYEPRPGGFEAMFHAGSLEFPAPERERILSVCETVPTVVVLYLDRAAVIPEIAAGAAALVVDFGADDDAVVDILTGVATARGLLPFDLPSSMTAVEASAPDAPFDTHNPAFRFGDGITA